MALYDRVKFTSPTTGTGTLTVGSAVAGFRTPAEAGVPNGGTFTYVIEDGTFWEIGTGTYTSAGTTVARSLISSSTAALINLSGGAVIYISAVASKLPQLDQAQTFVGNQTVTGDLSVSGALGAGNTTVTGTFAVSGNATASANLAVNGAATLGDAATDAHTINGTTSQTASAAGANGQTINMTNASFTGTGLIVRATRAGSSAFFLFSCGSNNGSDAEFYVNGAGTVASDGGTAMSTPADYADMFEWADGNPDNEDRRGYSVVLVGNKVRKSAPGDDPNDIVGVVSGNPSVCGGAAWNRWAGKYLRDEFNSPLYEEYRAIEWREAAEPTEENPKPSPIIRSYAVDGLPQGVTPPRSAVYSTQQRRVLNPEFVSGADYVPRSQRAEWDPIGLVGQLRLRKGQPVNPRWRKMRDYSETVEEWLVR